MLRVVGDDGGYSAAQDGGLLHCFAVGALTHAPVLVNGKTSKNFLQRACSVGLPVGLHLNLTEGCPTSAEGVPSLLAPGGTCMRGKYGFRKALSAGNLSQADLEREIDSQVSLFVSLHPTHAIPSYLDGHQHTHVLEGVAQVVARIMVKWGIGVVRVPILHEELGHLESGDSDYIARAEFYRGVSKAARCSLDTVFLPAGIRPSAHHFLGYSVSGADCTVERLRSVLCHTLGFRKPLLPFSVASMPLVELMVHPGFCPAPENASREERVNSGGASLTQCANRARLEAVKDSEGSLGGCVGESGPAAFSLSWEREREVAVLECLALEGLFSTYGR